MNESILVQDHTSISDPVMWVLTRQTSHSLYPARQNDMGTSVCPGYFFKVHCVVFNEASALWIMHEGIMHFHAMFLPLYFQPLNRGDLGGKGSDQSCQESWWENYPPRRTSRFFCWQAPPSNPEANVGTRRAKHVCISCADKTSLVNSQSYILIIILSWDLFEDFTQNIT